MPVQPTRGPTFTIGRDPDCDVPVTHDSVSRVHAEIAILEGGRYQVTDRNSRNGTRLLRQGRMYQLQQADVLPTDQLQLGEAMISVSDVLATIRQKHSTAGAGRLPADRARLMRCACGFVKPQNQICPECGQ